MPKTQAEADKALDEHFEGRKRVVNRKNPFPTLHPLVENPDGSHSNVRLGTWSFYLDREGNETEPSKGQMTHVVIPTMVGGQQLTDEEAVSTARGYGFAQYPRFADFDAAERWVRRHHGRIKPPAEE
jgi:hypothetical protein